MLLQPPLLHPLNQPQQMCLQLVQQLLLLQLLGAPAHQHPMGRGVVGQRASPGCQRAKTFLTIRPTHTMGWSRKQRLTRPLMMAEERGLTLLLATLLQEAGAEEGQGGQAEVGVLVAEQGPALWVRQLARNKQGVRTGLQQHGAEAVAGATGALAGSQARAQKGQTLKPPPAGVGAGAVAAGGDVVAGRTGTLRERCPRGLQKQQQAQMMQQEVVMRKWGTRSPGQTFYPPMPSQMLLGRGRF